MITQKIPRSPVSTENSCPDVRTWAYWDVQTDVNYYSSIAFLPFQIAFFNLKPFLILYICVVPHLLLAISSDKDLANTKEEPLY